MEKAVEAVKRPGIPSPPPRALLGLSVGSPWSLSVACNAYVSACLPISDWASNSTRCLFPFKMKKMATKKNATHIQQSGLIRLAKSKQGVGPATRTKKTNTKRGHARNRTCCPPRLQRQGILCVQSSVCCTSFGSRCDSGSSSWSTQHSTSH